MRSLAPVKRWLKRWHTLSLQHCCASIQSVGRCRVLQNQQNAKSGIWEALVVEHQPPSSEMQCLHRWCQTQFFIPSFGVFLHCWFMFITKQSLCVAVKCSIQIQHHPYAAHSTSYQNCCFIRFKGMTKLIHYKGCFSHVSIYIVKMAGFTCEYKLCTCLAAVCIL